MKLSPCSHETIANALPGSGKILEIGCGEGGLLQHLSECEKYELFAVEADAERAQIAAAVSSASVCNASAERLPFDDNFFDAVVMECVFSLCEPHKTVDEITRVLRSGGIAVIADLYASAESLTLTESPMLKNIYRKKTFVSFFENRFSLESFSDHTHALRNMFAQMLMSGTMCDCVSSADRPLLKIAKPGYGLWIWKKH